MKQFIGRLTLESADDGGRALICSVTDAEVDDPNMLVRVQSWDESLAHKEIRKFIGKRVLITIAELPSSEVPERMVVA